MLKNSKIIAVDFDGTCVSSEFPDEGKDIGAVPVLKRLIENGHKLILYTCRCNHDEDRYLSMNGGFMHLPAGQHLDAAIEWFKDNKIDLWGINLNPCESNYYTSKPHFDYLIDDKSIGIPLTTITLVDHSIVCSDKPFVDWGILQYMLENMGLI